MPTFVQEFICSNYSELFFHIHIVNVNPIEMFVSVSSMIRERIEKWGPLIKRMGDLITCDSRNVFFASVFTSKTGLQESQVSQTRLKGCSRQDTSLVKKWSDEGICKQIIHRIVRPDKMDRWVLGKLADVVVRLLSLTDPGDWQKWQIGGKEMPLLSSKRAEGITWGTIGYQAHLHPWKYGRTDNAGNKKFQETWKTTKSSSVLSMDSPKDEFLINPIWFYCIPGLH